MKRCDKTHFFSVHCSAYILHYLFTSLFQKDTITTTTTEKKEKNMLYNETSRQGDSYKMHEKFCRYLTLI